MESLNQSRVASQRLNSGYERLKASIRTINFTLKSFLPKITDFTRKIKD